MLYIHHFANGTAALLSSRPQLKRFFCFLHLYSRPIYCQCVSSVIVHLWGDCRWPRSISSFTSHVPVDAVQQRKYRSDFMVRGFFVGLLMRFLSPLWTRLLPLSGASCSFGSTADCASNIYKRGPWWKYSSNYFPSCRGPGACSAYSMKHSSCRRTYRPYIRSN